MARDRRTSPAWTDRTGEVSAGSSPSVTPGRYARPLQSLHPFSISGSYPSRGIPTRVNMSERPMGGSARVHADASYQRRMCRFDAIGRGEYDPGVVHVHATVAIEVVHA